MQLLGSSAVGAASAAGSGKTNDQFNQLMSGLQNMRVGSESPGTFSLGSLLNNPQEGVGNENPRMLDFLALMKR